MEFHRDPNGVLRDCRIRLYPLMYFLGTRMPMLQVIS